MASDINVTSFSQQMCGAVVHCLRSFSIWFSNPPPATQLHSRRTIPQPHSGRAPQPHSGRAPPATQLHSTRTIPQPHSGRAPPATQRENTPSHTAREHPQPHSHTAGEHSQPHSGRAPPATQRESTPSHTAGEHPSHTAREQSLLSLWESQYQ